jgi:hypothetical protein
MSRPSDLSTKDQRVLARSPRAGRLEAIGGIRAFWTRKERTLSVPSSVRGSSYYSVRAREDFGATGDGSTDDTAAFQSALYVSLGKILFVDAGSCFSNLDGDHSFWRQDCRGNVVTISCVGLVFLRCKVRNVSPFTSPT